MNQPCNHVHVKHGACQLEYGHSGAHSYQEGRIFTGAAVQSPETQQAPASDAQGGQK